MAQSINGAQTYFFRGTLNELFGFSNDIYAYREQYGMKDISDRFLKDEKIVPCGPRSSYHEIRRIEVEHQEEMPIADNYTFH